jgi:hypothetical protein
VASDPELLREVLLGTLPEPGDQLVVPEEFLRR